jgi:Trk K+ transport system NAD-binding subunit
MQTDRFLVCGLGSLGQHCVSVLEKFGVQITAIDRVRPTYWDVPELPGLLDSLVIGDCRAPDILEQCEIQNCRSILLVTDNERVNIETAFVARLKNPQIRLVIRSAQKNLNRLLPQQLENSVALEPTEITSTAFALAALGDETRGSFYTDGHLVQVIERRIHSDDPLISRTVGKINAQHRILAHRHNQERFSSRFFQWNPDAKIKAGDHLLYLNIPSLNNKLTSERRLSKTKNTPLGNGHAGGATLESSKRPSLAKQIVLLASKTSLSPIWRHRLVRLVLVCLTTVIALLCMGSFLFYAYGPGLSLTDATYAAIALMLGGYVDLLGSELTFDMAIPWWLRFFGLLQTITGTVLIGALYALITSHILATRFNFGKRPRFPKSDHIIVIGWGRIGQEVTRILSDFGQSFIVITRDQPRTPNQFPILAGVDDTGRALSQVNLENAKGVISVTNDEMTNLELGLMAHGINSSCQMVLRTYHDRFGFYVKSLFPYAKVRSSSVLGAEAFAAAAFGENIVDLFVRKGQTILVTQYTVEEEDTLCGRILAEIAYGYNVVPLVLKQSQSQNAIWTPSDNIRLMVGDRLTVLATIESLRRIEKGDMVPPTHQLTLQRVHTQWAKSEGVMIIANNTDCTLGDARNLIENLPGTLPKRLYYHQGCRLLDKLRKMGYEAGLREMSSVFADSAQ